MCGSIEPKAVFLYTIMKNIEKMVCAYFGITLEQYDDTTFRNSVHHIEKDVIFKKPIPAIALKYTDHNRSYSEEYEWITKTLRDCWKYLLDDLQKGEKIYPHCSREYIRQTLAGNQYQDYSYYVTKDVIVTWGEMLDKAKEKFENIDI